MTGPELVDALLKKTGDVSDYALAKRLGVSRNTISMIRKEEQGFSPELARKICIILDEDPGKILAWMYAWKSKDKGTRDFWKKAASAALIILVVGAYSPVKAAVFQSIHYANLYRDPASRPVASAIHRLTPFAISKPF